MATQSPVERPRGTLDVLPEDCYVLAEIQQRLDRTFESFGYRRIDVPVIEHSELYLRKSGSDIIAKMYAFTDQGQRRVCLRPEFTASVLRAFLHSRSRLPYPARLWYAGPSFRFEKPQKGRYRQFTQVGVELIGAAGPLADVEVMGLALRCLQALRLRQYRIVLGHIGIVSEFLARLDLDERARTLFIESLESLRKQGRGLSYVKARLAELFPDAEEVEREEKSGAAELLATTERGDAVALVSQLLEKMNVELSGQRRPEEIVDRLLSKLATRGRGAKLEQALQFVVELSSIHGEPAKALAGARDLLTRYGLDQQPLTEIEQVVQLLSASARLPELTLDFSLARGLQYYTGVIFEIYEQGIGSEDQVCGGGRYDGLARTLGAGDDVPALGFSFGLERLKLSLEAEGVAPAANERGPLAVVVPVNGCANAYAMRVASSLRAAGLPVELEVRGRGLRAGLEYANRARLGFAVVVGEQEQSEASFILRDMSSGEQSTYGLDAAAEAAERIRGPKSQVQSPKSRSGEAG